VTANDAVDLAVAPGTVHAIVGENGAGKTTLMRLLYGLDRPDEGSVVVDDRDVRLSSPADAATRGIGMVHQELKLFGELTALENLVLGREPMRRGRIDWPAARRRAEALAEESGATLDWARPAAEMPMEARQRLEILRLMHRDADVLILDEPTAVLGPAQIDDLLELMRRLRDGGRTLLFISHKLREVLAVADTITVLRGGAAVATTPAGSVDADELVRLMVGERPPRVEAARARATAHEGATPALRARNLSVVDRGGVQRLRDVSLDIAAGEIVGVAGVAGNGQDELVEALVGLRPVRSGTIEIAGRAVHGRPVGARRRAGLGYIPAERRTEGLAVDSSVTDNAIAGLQRSSAVASHGWLLPGAPGRFAAGLVERYRIRCGSLALAAGRLSGGNQQRLILGRELAGEPKLLIASQPTRGVDVNGAAYLHERLLELRDEGVGVLLVSEELDELAALADRVVVLAGGAVAGEVEGPLEDFAAVGALMTAAPTGLEAAA
jgi:general nucleoside transport system ATP-binding protein